MNRFYVSRAMTNTSLSPPSSKGREHHLQTLDLLRGVAAICVVLFHFSSRVNFAGLMYHGYLAVDLFYVLSGFVICKAYYSNINRGVLSFRSFSIMRLVRLMPLLILGNTIAAFIDLFRTGHFQFGTHVSDIIVAFMLGCLLLPTFFKTTLEDTTYPLNGPIWSLFFELFANLVFFFVARLRFFKYISVAICAVSLAILIRYSLITGNIHFGPHVTYFWLAFPRVLFSFFVGVLLNYTNFKHFYLNRWCCVGLVVAVVAVPPIKSLYLSAMFDLTVISVVFPFVIVACIQQSWSDSRVAWLSGNLSYPIYCIHYPLVRVFSTIMRHFSLSVSLNIIFSLVLAVLMMIASLMIFEVYDRPVRKKLTTLLLPSSRRKL